MTGDYANEKAILFPKKLKTVSSAEFFLVVRLNKTPTDSMVNVINFSMPKQNY